MDLKGTDNGEIKKKNSSRDIQIGILDTVSQI
jgi:hypothetical protein